MKQFVKISIMLLLFSITLFFDFNEFISLGFFDLLVKGFPDKFDKVSLILSSQKNLINILNLLEITILYATLEYINWFKNDFTLKIEQRNEKYLNEKETYFNDIKLREPSRTVRTTIAFSNKFSFGSWIILKIIKGKIITLQFSITDSDSEFLTLESDDLEAPDGKILKVDITETIIQILEQKNETLNDTLKYILDHNLMPNGSKDKDFLVIGNLLLDDKSYKDFLLLKFFLKIKIETHKVKMKI